MNDPHEREPDIDYVLFQHMDDAEVGLTYLEQERTKISQKREQALEKYRSAETEEDKTQFREEFESAEQEYYDLQEEHQQTYIQWYTVVQQKKEFLEKKKADGDELNEQQKTELTEFTRLVEAFVKALESSDMDGQPEWIRAIQQHAIDNNDSAKFREMTDLVREK